MNTLITLCHDFDAVFLIDGAFTENSVISTDDEDIIYLTVLPLSPLHLPYTIKLAGGKILSGELFATSYSTDEGFLIKLRPRFSYVYSVSPHDAPGDAAAVFFDYIKNGELQKARALMTKDLSASITDDDLKDFFADYRDIIKVKDKYFLINSKNKAEPFAFVIKSALIDDITSI